MRASLGVACALCAMALLTAWSARDSWTDVLTHNVGKARVVPRFQAGGTGASEDLARARSMLHVSEQYLLEGQEAARRTARTRNKEARRVGLQSAKMEEAGALNLVQDARHDIASAEDELRAEPAAVAAALKAMHAGYGSPIALDVAGYAGGAPPGVIEELEREGHRLIPLSHVVGRQPANRGALFADEATGEAVTLLVVSRIKWSDRALVDITGSVNGGPTLTVTLQDSGYIVWYMRGHNAAYKPSHLGDGWRVMSQSAG